MLGQGAALAAEECRKEIRRRGPSSPRSTAHPGWRPRSGLTVTGHSAEVRVLQHVVPVRMRGEACHDGPAQLAEVVREGRHFAAGYARVDEQHTVPALDDNGIALRFGGLNHGPIP